MRSNLMWLLVVPLLALWPAAPSAQGFTVSESTGLVRYEYPFELPPARGRFQPRLGLTSSSGDWLAYPKGCQRNNTGVGATWSLDLPAILHDGGGSSAVLTYYVPGRGTTLKATTRDGGSLAAEIETGYLKVTRINTVTLLAVDAAGNQLTFVTGSATNAAYPYLLKTVTDLDGNVALYTWQDQAGERLSRIDYNAFRSGAADPANTSAVGQTGAWGTSVELGWTNFNSALVLDTVQVTVKAVAGAVNQSTNQIEPTATVARQYKLAYGATASYPNSGSADDTSLVSITESGATGGGPELRTEFDRAANGCISSVRSPLGARTEIYFEWAYKFGVGAQFGTDYPVVKKVTRSGPAMATNVTEYWYSSPGTVSGKYAGFTTTTTQESATRNVRQTSWMQSAKPFVGMPAAVSLGTETSPGDMFTLPSFAPFQTRTYTRAARSIGSGGCAAIPAASDYPVIAVETSVLDQRTVGGVKLGTMLTRPCPDVDAWGNTKTTVFDPDTSYSGDDLTSTTTYYDPGSPQVSCKDCVKNRTTKLGTSKIVEQTEVSYDAKWRVQQVQRQSDAAQVVAAFPVVAAYGYFDNGNLSTWSEGGVTYRYTYDDWFQVRLAKESAIDVANASEPAAKQIVKEIMYDSAGRPSQVIGPYYVNQGTAQASTPKRHLAYDGLGRIVSVARDAIVGTTISGGLAAFSYQPWDPAAPFSPASVTSFQFAVAKAFTAGAPPTTGDVRLATTFLDGMGRSIQTRERLGAAGADPATNVVEPLVWGGGSRYLVRETTVLDAAGRPRAVVAPYYSSNAAYVDPLNQNYAAGQEAVKGPVLATWTRYDTQGRPVCSTVRTVAGTLAASEPAAGACTSTFLEDGTYARATRMDYRGTTLNGRAVMGVKTVEPRFTATTTYASLGAEVFLDAGGRTRQAVDAEGNKVTYVFDELGRSTGTVREAPGSVRGSITSSVTLDMMGRLTTRTDPNMGVRKFIYDPTTPGLVTVVEFNKTKEQVKYGYDMGRLASVMTCSGAGACSTQSTLWWDLPFTGEGAGGFEYTAGRIGYATDSNTTIALSYDDSGSLARRDQWVKGSPGYFSFAATRREDRRATAWTFSADPAHGLDDVTLQFGFDSAGRTKGAWEGGRLLWQSVSGPDGTGSYDAWGRIGSVSMDEGHASQTWTYAAVSGLQASQTVTVAGAPNPVVYNVNGMRWRGTQLISMSDQVDKTTTNYWYSQAGRLVASQVKNDLTTAQVDLSCIGFNASKEYTPGPSFGNIEMVRNASGVPTTTNYSYLGTNTDAGVGAAGPDAPTAVGTTAIQYGDFGRIVSKGTGEAFGYNILGQLTSVTRTGNSETIAYDPFGQLLWRKVGTAETWYLGRHATVTGVGGQVAVDLHVEVGGKRVASNRVGVNPRTLFLHRDRLTSVVATSLAGGVQGATYRYDPHGASTALIENAASNGSELGFAGAVRLTGGLLLMGARVYDPALKIFLQPDPLAPHQYTYAGGDPINRWDPTGLEDQTVDPATAKKNEDRAKLEALAKEHNAELLDEVVVTGQRDNTHNGYFDQNNQNGQGWNNVTGNPNGGRTTGGTEGKGGSDEDLLKKMERRDDARAARMAKLKAEMTKNSPPGPIPPMWPPTPMGALNAVKYMYNLFKFLEPFKEAADDAEEEREREKQGGP